jgi:hypothetical protein
VEQEILSPSVQHSGHGDLCAEVFGIASDLAQGRGRCVEEDGEQEPLVAQDQRIQLVGQREDEVKVWDWQQPLEALLEPLFTLRTLALWTVPIAAGVVGDAPVSAAVALVEMTPECGGATGSNVT